jgi:hypothetical protein
MPAFSENAAGFWRLCAIPRRRLDKMPGKICRALKPVGRARAGRHPEGAKTGTP